jgi:hypothetical protein
MHPATTLVFDLREHGQAPGHPVPGSLSAREYEPAQHHNGHEDHTSSKKAKTVPVIREDPGSAADPVHPSAA